MFEISHVPTTRIMSFPKPNLLSYSELRAKVKRKNINSNFYERKVFKNRKMFFEGV